jgi:hypothetical protein
LTAGSFVVCVAVNEGTRLAASFSGSCKLNGWDPSSLLPIAPMLPVICIVPYAAVWPTATVPSWQLKQSVLTFPTTGCTETFWLVPLE